MIVFFDIVSFTIFAIHLCFYIMKSTIQNGASELNRKAYLSLLRAALWNEEPEIAVPFDWKEVIQIAENQSTLPVIFFH